MPINPHGALLQECRDLFRDNLIEAVRRTFDGMDESLMALADKTTSYELRSRYLDARDVARKHRAVIEAQFKRSFLSEFQSRVDLSRSRSAAAEGFSLDDLQLVGDEEMNETLSFNDMATKMRRECEDEMSALDQRAAVLLGKQTIQADDNPFGAKVVTDAFKNACQQIDCPVDVRLVFMKSFETLAMESIRGSVREVNELLIANAVLPKIRYGYAKNESKPKSAAGESTPAVQAVPGNKPTPQEDMFSMLSSMLGGPAGGFGGGAGAGGAGGNGGAGPGLGVGGAPLIEGAQLMGSLTSLQRGDLSALGAAAEELAPILAEAGNLQNVLKKLKSTSVGQGMGQMDAMTLEIVSMLFDALFEDQKVPAALKGLIGRLQLPMLKVAIADKELFSSKLHPARRLLDTMGQLGMRLPRDLGPENAIFQRLEIYVDELVHVFQDNMEIFDTTRLTLEAIIAGEDSRIALQMQATQKELERAEKLALAKAEAQADLRARIAVRPDIPHSVVEFLVQQWIKYLVVVQARDGRESDAWRKASESTDQLIWSVLPKSTPEDRRALTGAIPNLLRALKAGVAEAGIEDDVAMAFFAELMTCHKSALRVVHVPPAVAAALFPEKPAEPPKIPEALLDFTQPVTVNNPFGEGKVQVDDNDLDFTAVREHEQESEPSVELVTPAVAHRVIPPARKIRLPNALIVGAWVSVADLQSRTERPARLHYVSPLKSHFLFVDRQGNKVYECSRTMLAGRIALGEVTLLDGEPDASLFDRIMEGIFGKLKKPAVGLVPQAA